MTKSTEGDYKCLSSKIQMLLFKKYLNILNCYLYAAYAWDINASN